METALVTRRPRYGCRSCESAVVQAPAPARIVEGGIPTEALLVCRSTAALSAGRDLRPARRLRRSERLFADETTAPVLDPGRGRTKTGQLWAYARDDRPWGGGDPPMVAYVYAADSKGERAEAHLGDFAGILQVDGYSGYAALARRRQQIQLAFCWAHVRRKFYELVDASPVAPEFISKDLDLWAWTHGVVLDFGRPGKPTDNAFAESFNGRVRAECLNAFWFLSLDDARVKCEAWRIDCNEVRPHSSLGNQTPMERAFASGQACLP